MQDLCTMARYDMSVDRIDTIIFISDDALGPLTRSLFVRLRDGGAIVYEGDRDIPHFCVCRSARRLPDAASHIDRELAAKDRPRNYEKVVYKWGQYMEGAG